MSDPADIEQLNTLNTAFIEACRLGSWPGLRKILSDWFRYVDGTTGQMWDMAEYIADLEAHPDPTLRIDQVVIHMAGDTAGVTARTSNRSGTHNRYLDVYAREPSGWRCVQACVWPTQA